MKWKMLHRSERYANDINCSRLNPVYGLCERERERALKKETENMNHIQTNLEASVQPEDHPYSLTD